MADHIFKSVLLLEKNPAHAEIVRQALHGFCAKIIQQDSLNCALTQTNPISPDLIVVDLELGETAAVQIITQLSNTWPLVPIVALTESLKLQEAIEAMKLGVREVIVKAFDGPFHEILILSISRISATLKAEAERLKMQMDLEALRIAIENSKDGLAVTDAGGKLVYCSPAFKDFMRSCGAGDSFLLWEIFSDKVEDCEKLQKTIQNKYQQLTTGSIWHTEIKFSENKNLAYDLSLSAIRAQKDLKDDTAQTTNESVVWVHDISEVKRREKFQREILSTTTHDLKNPLSSIMLSAELASNIIKDNQKASQLILRIGSSAHTAVNLIDQFLSARRIKDGSFVLHPNTQDVNSLVDEVVDSFETVALARGIKLKFSKDEPKLEWLVDRTGLQRALSNLLSNALKFTPQGGSVTVSSKVHLGALHIAVSDTGHGLAPFELSQLFERFTRLDQHADLPGTGLGLFIVKSILSAHGGRVEVTSQLKHGTTFELVFPYAPPVNEHGELIVLDFG